VNSIGRLMPGDYWVGWNSVMRTHVSSNRLVLVGAS
jgi:hypothetical protein